MDKATIEATQNVKSADLKELAFVEGPCLTMFVPARNYALLKNATHAAQSLLKERGMSDREVREFLEPLAHIEGESYGSLVAFRSKDLFKYFQVREELQESAIVADQFQVLSFLKALQDEHKHFYLLALSQKHVRLLRCTNHSADEVPLGPNTPTNVEQWLETRTPTSSADGPTAGAFTSTTDRDKLDEHIANFFRQIDSAVFEILRGETAPLVVCAVEYEATMWREINRYPHLVEGHVQGSPESLKGGEMHKRALEIVQKAFEEPMHKALELYERMGGSERVTSSPKEVAKAAAGGRVAHLFLSGTDELVNAAALQTIAHGGDVWMTEPKFVPGGGPVAALLRY